jgi:hypothetical protein
MYQTLPSGACLEGEIYSIPYGGARAPHWDGSNSFDPPAGLLEPRLSEALHVVAREYGYSVVGRV